MKFDLRRPCSDCPFRTDCLKDWLSGGRATEIAQALTLEQATFACHKTTEAGGNEPGNEQHCAGALLVLENDGHPPPQNARVAERLGLADPEKLDRGSPVFASLDDFIAHHENDRDRRGEPCAISNAGCEAPAGFQTSYGGAVDNFVREDQTEECAGCCQDVCDSCSSIIDGKRWCAFCMEEREEAA